jgi:hypothetical protein
MIDKLVLNCNDLTPFKVLFNGRVGHARTWIKMTPASADGLIGIYFEGTALEWDGGDMSGGGGGRGRYDRHHRRKGSGVERGSAVSGAPHGGLLPGRNGREKTGETGLPAGAIGSLAPLSWRHRARRVAGRLEAFEPLK